jgi:hypothetical protein
MSSMKTLGGCLRIACASLACLLATVGVLAGLWLGVMGTRLRLDVRNPKTPRARSAIFADPRAFLPAVESTRAEQVSGIEAIEAFSTSCWRGLSLMVVLLIVNVAATPSDRRKRAWLEVLVAALTLLLFLSCARAATPAGLRLPVPAAWPPAGRLRGAAMYTDLIAAFEMMKTVADLMIAMGALTVVVFTVLAYRAAHLILTPA